MSNKGSELVLGIQKSLNIDKFTWDQIDFSTIDTVFINQPFKEIRYPDLDSLRNINYVSVDFGFERGIDQENTIEAVNNILTKNNFKLKNLSEYRLIGLYQNVNIE